MSRFASGISAPHATPITASARLLSKAKAPRAPMVNPYDKFTQPEFDSWIGDLTDTLRRALGYEQEEQVTNSPEKTQFNGDTNGHIPDYRPVDLSEGDEDPDDSFAQIKSRRAKGKARDPREGPGLGRGDRVQPIEIVSSDEEEEEEVEGLALSVQEEQDDVETEEEEDDEEEDEDEDDEDEDYAEQLWDRGQSSSQILSSPVAMKFGPPKRSRFMVEAESEKAESEEGSEALDHIEEGYELNFDTEIEYPRESDLPDQNGADEVITISDDDEDVVSFGRQSYEFPDSLRDTAFRNVEEGVEGRERDGPLDIEEVQPLDDDTCMCFLFFFDFFPDTISCQHFHLPIHPLNAWRYVILGKVPGDMLLISTPGAMFECCRGAVRTLIIWDPSTMNCSENLKTRRKLCLAKGEFGMMLVRAPFRHSHA